MAFLPYPPASTTDVIAVLRQDAGIAHEIIHGNVTADVDTESGLVPSFAKVVKTLTDEVNAATGVDTTLRANLAAVNSTVLIAGVPASKVANLVKNVLNPLDFGAFFNGDDDDAPAIRRALDAVPSFGGTVQFPFNRKCKIGSVIFIPQRLNPLTVDGNGITLDLNNCIIFGGGNHTLFESGSGAFSTVALGGKSNWSEPDESGTSIHYNSCIKNGIFTDFGNGIRLKNWIQNCRIENIYGADFTGKLIETKRCFYLAQSDITGRPFTNGRAANNPILHYDDSNNTMSFYNIHVSGIAPDTSKRGIGFLFSGGVQGVALPAGCSAEACVDGVLLTSFIYSMSIRGFYTEVCNTAIRSSGANVFNLDISDCEFEDNVNDVNIDNWVDGTFSASNKTEASVVFGAGCRHTVELPAASYTTSDHTAYAKYPAGWTVPAGCTVLRNDTIYNPDGGFSAVVARNSRDVSGGAGVLPHSYTGVAAITAGIIPFCLATVPSAGVLTVKTAIEYSDKLSSVLFDVVVTNNGVETLISGRVAPLNTVYRNDSTAGVTVTAVENGGMLQLNITGLGTITGFSGKVRVV
jgi:hypothetical protein